MNFLILWFRFSGRLKVGDGSPSRVQMAGPSDGLHAAGLAAGNQEWAVCPMIPM